MAASATKPKRISASYKRHAKRMSNLKPPPYVHQAGGQAAEFPNQVASPQPPSTAQRRANAPLRPTVAQQPRHELGGLFGDTHNQLDLIDIGRSRPVMERQMTKVEAQAALEAHTKVEAGKGEDHDTGYILAINGDMADVGWDSGVRTPCAIADLSVA